MKFQTKVSLFFSVGISTVLLLLLAFVAAWVGNSKKQEIFDYQSAVTDLLTSQSATTAIAHVNGQAGYVHWDIFKPDGSPFGEGGGITSMFSNESVQLLKTVPSGRKSLELRDTAKQGVFATIHVGPHYLVIASTPTAVYRRFLIVTLLPIVILLVALLGLSFLVGQSVSKIMTGDIKRLTEAFTAMRPDVVTKIAEDKFSVEFREVAAKTNLLQDRIQKFIQDLKSKARLDSELEIAREVQKSLFPAAEITNAQFTIRSRFFSADECSGDWYYYSVRDQSLWIVVGDVTGHGVSSAILASVCRGVWPAVEQMPIDQPHLVLEQFNNVISSLASSGKYMTMVVLSIDLSAKKYFISSASHEPPIVVRSGGAKPAGDLLDSHLNPRIGSGFGLSYRSSSGDIKNGDSVLLFSDGIYELSMPNGRKFNDRGLIRQLEKENPSNWVNFISSRVGKKLVDDISVVQVTIN